MAFKYAEFLEQQGRFSEAKEKLEIAVHKLPRPERKQEAGEALGRVARALHAVRSDRETSHPPPDGGNRVGLISCTCRKKSYACTARELYSESDRFREHLAFAEMHYQQTYVVSAKHGLVELTQILSPYDLSLDKYEVEERDSWAGFICARLRLEGIDCGWTVYVHATTLYNSHLSQALKDHGINKK